MPKSPEQPSHRATSDALLAEHSGGIANRKKSVLGVPLPGTLRQASSSPDVYASAMSTLHQQASLGTFATTQPITPEPKRPGRPKKKVDPPSVPSTPIPGIASPSPYGLPRHTELSQDIKPGKPTIAMRQKVLVEEPTIEVNAEHNPFLTVDDLSAPLPDLDDLKETKLKALAHIVKEFDPAQLDRYEAFRRSSFNRLSIKKVMQLTTHVAVGDRATIVMAGIAKVYVGQLVELALSIMQERGETGKIQPEHLREARRRAESQGILPWIGAGSHRPLLRRWR